MAVHRTWKKYNLKPHLVEKFKLSNSPNYVENVKDIVGLCLNPPEKVLVLCIDEKSQIQDLDRYENAYFDDTFYYSGADGGKYGYQSETRYYLWYFGSKKR